ncbi:ARID/BRIGHT DNA-binding domain containing protein [Pseudohyphozyma bogoriensis]|nr:ARID/BRIGHT DNA-binding domain containing protein [Pseudohyphozyma bogoriensis]
MFNNSTPTSNPWPQPPSQAAYPGTPSNANAMYNPSTPTPASFLPGQTQPQTASMSAIQEQQRRMMFQQQQAQMRQAQGAAGMSQPPTSSPFPSHSPAVPQHNPQFDHYAQQQPPSTPINQQQQRPPMPPSAHIPPQVAALLQGLTPETFNNMPQQQQAILRHYMQQQKMVQQSALGMGYPGQSPAASNAPSPSVGSPLAAYQQQQQGQQQQGQRPSPQQAPQTGAPGQQPMGQSPAPPQQNGVPPQVNQVTKALTEWYRSKGQVVPPPPVIEGKQLDYGQMYALVARGGGFQKVSQSGTAVWRQIAASLFPGEPPASQPDSRVQSLVQVYQQVVMPFEMHVMENRMRQLQAQQHQQGQQQQGSPPNPQLQNGARPSGSAPTPVPSHPQPPPAPVTIPQPMAPPQPMPQPSLEDRKGKGKATDGSGKQTPMKLDMTELPLPGQQPPAPQPPNPMFGGAIPDSKPEEVVPKSATPTGPVRRKRQKYEYVPLTRTTDTYASWDLGQVEEVLTQVSARKRPRMAHDLGMIDVHSLTMSLRSRLASEVAFALNSLTLVSLRPQNADPQAPYFPLSACGGLFEELVDLLEEAAFGLGDDEDEEEGVPTDSKSSSTPAASTAPSRLSYRELFRLVTQEQTELQTTEPNLESASILTDDDLTPLRPTELILSLTNLFRNLSIFEENIKIMASRPRFLEVLVKVANLPLRREGGTARWPLRLSAADSLAVKKDVLETIGNFGLDVRLSSHSPSTAATLFSLLTFFLTDADHTESLYFDLSTSPSSSSRYPQASPRISHYLDLGLATFARITLPDANRYILANVTGVDLYALFEALIHLLPITEADFQLVTSEPGLVFAENLTMSLYNLAFLAPTDVKLRLRNVPGFIKAFLRVIRRLAGSGDQETPFVTLCDHCVASLRILSEVGGVSGSQAAADGLWWGLGPNPDGDDRPRNPQPTEMDRASVKARQPPRSVGSGRPAVLAAEARGIFELLQNAAAPVAAFTKLVSLLDPSGGKPE